MSSSYRRRLAVNKLLLPSLSFLLAEGENLPFLPVRAESVWSHLMKQRNGAAQKQNTPQGSPEKVLCQIDKAENNLPDEKRGAL